MQIVQHRVNTIAALENIPVNYGVELDIRDKYQELVVQHDAFLEGENWDQYLSKYRHGLLIANIKTEGVEEKVMSDLEKNNIQDYFLLDISLPYLVKLSNKGFRKMAVRFSEYEPLDFVMGFAGKLDWVWVDCFHDLPLDAVAYAKLHEYFKICLVSPELHGQDTKRIAEFKNRLSGFTIDAVCTKRPDLWLG